MSVFDELIKMNFDAAELGDLNRETRSYELSEIVSELITEVQGYYSPSEIATALEEALEDLWQAVTDGDKA